MIGGCERVRVTEREEAAIVTVIGDILDEADDLEYVLQCVVEGRIVNIVVDLTRCQYLSARAIRVLRDTVSAVRRRRGGMSLVSCDERMVRLLRGVGLENFMEIHSTIEDALDGFAGGVASPEKLMLWNSSEVLARA